MKKLHQVQHIHLKADQLFLTVDGKEYIFELSKISQKLAEASDYERSKYRVSPSGYGIHWPLLDEDLSIDGLLGIRHTPTAIREETVSA